MSRYFLPPLFAVLVLLGTTAPASAQLNLSQIDDLFTQEARVEVNVQGALLRLVAEASRSSEPEFAAMVENLQGVFVRQYDLSAARSNLGDRVSSFARSLEQGGWQTLVRVREDDEDVFIYLRPQGDVIAGLVVMSLSRDDNEATFVSIDGIIDPAEIGRLGSRFNIDALEDISHY